MADNMKFPPFKLVSERDGIGRHFANGKTAGNIPRVAVAADIGEDECVAVGIEAVENRSEHPVIPEPSVNDHDLGRAVAYRFVPSHFAPRRFCLFPLPASTTSCRPWRTRPCRPRPR